MPGSAITATTRAAPPSPSIPPIPASRCSAVPLLVRSKGAEIGVRTQAFKGLDARSPCSCSISIRSSLFVGDAGTTEPSRPSQRIGVELTNNYRPTPWASFDLDLAYTQARFTDYSIGGDQIPGSPAFIASGGVTLGGDDRLVRRACVCAASARGR